MSLIACLTIAFAIALVLWRLPSLRGTTLLGPAMWVLAALVAIGLYELFVARGRAVAPSDSVRLLFTSLTLCPAISLVGAKRPQDKPWHFIVGSLWIVIALPALQALVLTNRESPAGHPARQWFLLGLIVFAVANSLFSRFWLCVLLAGVGSAILLSPSLPFPFAELSGLDPVWGALSYSLAAIVAVFISFISKRSNQASLPLDTLWRDFRDGFGLLWTLRIAERMNATAQANDWNVSADWQGIRVGKMSEDQLRSFRQNLSNLLRRFVNEEWIARRLDS